MDNDPVHEADGTWWFWDECWCDRLGPYATEQIARHELDRYCIWLLTGQTTAQKNHLVFVL